MYVQLLILILFFDFKRNTNLVQIPAYITKVVLVNLFAFNRLYQIK
jgi:hypothetical protein